MHHSLALWVTAACSHAFLLLACACARDASTHREDGGASVPESCGSGTWGDLPVDEATVYVDIAADGGGEGTAGAPLRSIQSALGLAGSRGGGLVAVAAGTYPETLELSSAHSNVQIAGRCRELVTLDASVGDEESSGVNIDSRYGPVELSGLTLRGAPRVGVLVRSGPVRMEDVLVSGSSVAGIWIYSASVNRRSVVDIVDSLVESSSGYGMVVSDGATTVTLTRTTVRGTRPDDEGYGFGVHVSDGAIFEADRCTFSDNTSVGLWIRGAGSEALLRDCSVRDQCPEASGEFGNGVEADDGASLTLERCALSGNAFAGAAASDPGTRLTMLDCIVQDTVADGNGAYGHAIMTNSGSHGSIEGCLIRGSAKVGLTINGLSTRVEARDTEVSDTLFNAVGNGGFGAQVFGGGALAAEGCRFVRSATAGVLAEGEGVQVSLRDCVLRDTRPNGDLNGGYGLEANDHASVVLDGCAILDSTAVGVLAANVGTEVVLRDCLVAGTMASWDERGMTAAGIECQRGASITCSGLRSQGNEGPAIFVTQPGSRLVCSGCEISDEEFAGAVVVVGGELELDSTVISAVGESVNLGGGVGVYAAMSAGIVPPALSLLDCSISDNLVAGIWLTGEGSFLLEDNLIEDSRGEAFGAGQRCGDGVYARSVAAWDGSSGLALVGNTLRGNAGAGVLLDDASAMLEGNTWEDNEPDLLVQGGACPTPDEDYAEVPQVEVCPAWDRPACDLYFSLSLEVADFEPNLPPIQAHRLLTAGPPPPRRMGRVPPRQPFQIE